MPYGDGKGPPKDQGNRGARMRGNRPGAGPEGTCLCPGCGKRLPHTKGQPCFDQICPQCGTKMIRG